MMLTLMVSLLASAPPERAAEAIRSDDPPIKISLNQDNYFQRGDRARVKVRTAEDGYVVVLRSDAQGRVRVLFPLDPTDDDFVRGGRTLEVRGRGDREAFYVDDADGAGLVLAARSAAPFKFDEFVRGDHWDYRVLTVREAGDDKEQALLDIAQRMTPDGHFDYDVAHYTVASVDSYSSGYNHYYSPFGMRVGFGYGYGGWPYYRYGAYSSCYDPFFYDPFFCGASLYDPFFYRPYYRPFIYTGGFVIYSRPRHYGGGLFIDRAQRWSGGAGGGLVFKDRFAGAPTVMGVSPRLRVPQGTLLSRAGAGRVVQVSAPPPRPARVRDSWSDPAVARAADRVATPTRARGEPSERRAPEAQPPARRDAGRADRPSSSGGGGSSERLGAGGRPGVSGRALLRRARHAPPQGRRQVRVRAPGVRAARRVRGGLGGKRRDVHGGDRRDRRRGGRVPGATHRLGQGIASVARRRPGGAVHRGEPDRRRVGPLGTESRDRGEGPGAGRCGGDRVRPWHGRGLARRAGGRAAWRRRLAGAGARVALGDLDLLRLPRRRQDRRGGGGSGAHAPPGVFGRHRDRDRPVPALERRVPARAAARADRDVEPGRRGRRHSDRGSARRRGRRRARAARRAGVAQRQHLRHAARVVRPGTRGLGARGAGARESGRDALGRHGAGGSGRGGARRDRHLREAARPRHR